MFLALRHRTLGSIHRTLLSATLNNYTFHSSFGDYQLDQLTTMTSYQRWTLLTSLLVACLCCVLVKSDRPKFSIGGTAGSESITLYYSHPHRVMDLQDYWITALIDGSSPSIYTFTTSQDISINNGVMVLKADFEPIVDDDDAVRYSLSSPNGKVLAEQYVAAKID